MATLTIRGAPLAAADAIEWGTRRLDLFILGLFATPAAVGVYYIAQQVASLPQKLKTSFDPILGPVITRALKDKDYAAIARQVCQVGFWITAMQAGIALALGIPGEAIMPRCKNSNPASPMACRLINQRPTQRRSVSTFRAHRAKPPFQLAGSPLSPS